jgi:predicted RND superfamily exporter protein
MERFHEEYHRLGDKQAAIISSYVNLFDPAFVSVAADALALLTLAAARIPVIQNLAFAASFWILTITVSVITLHPVLLSLLPPPYRDNKAGARLSDRFYTLMCHFLVWFSRDDRRYVSVVVLIFVLTLGISFSLQLQVGTMSIGEALMYPQHPYTIAARKVAEKFIGTSQMIVVAEGRVDHALKKESVLTAIEAFQWHMQQHNAAGSASATSTIKRVFRLLHEGDPNWEILPTRQHDIDTSFFLMSGNPELVRLLVDRYRNTPITLYYQYASNAEAKQALSAAKEFLAAHPQETVTFRLAGGLIGILAAVQEEVERSHRYNLLLILIAVFICGYLIYRSALGALIVMLPSLIAQPLAEAVMYVASIDMNVSSLPVVAVGIGIGIDYGYYVLSRIIEEYAVCQDFDEANRRALLTTGKAVFFTGTTLVAGVILWVFFPMKFHAEMAIVLSAILIFHVVGALVFIPAAISLLHPRFASDLAQRMTAESARYPWSYRVGIQ